MKTEEKKSSQPLSITVEILPKQNTSIPTLDWLQFNFDGTFEESKKYESKYLQMSTRIFKNIIEVWQKKWRRATIVNQPFSSVIPPNTNLIKLDNRELYYTHPVNRLIEIGASYNLKYKSCSRIDIALDFNCFYNNLHPATMINNFLTNKFIKVGMKTFIVQGKQSDNLDCHYLKFTSKKATISAYLYNKSKELRDVKKKNYIIKHWEDSGLNTNIDVWRLEFSIHTNKFNIINKNTGNIEQFDALLLDNEFYRKQLLTALINKYWNFKYKDNHKKIAQKKDVKFFTNISNAYDIQFLREDKDTGRADLIFYNKLKDVNNEVREISKYLTASTNSILSYYEESRNIKKVKSRHNTKFD